MKRLAQAAFVFYLAAGAWAAEPDRKDPPKAGGRSPAPEKLVECLSCRFDGPEGTTNCWACGTRLPDSSLTRDLPPIKALVVRVLPEKKERRADALDSPEIAFERVAGWIVEHPDDYDGAIKRLGELTEKVRGTALESIVQKRIDLIDDKRRKANRPRSPEEREADAAKAVLEAYARIRRTPELHRENVLELQKLLKRVEGTSYEGPVGQRLEEEQAKLGSRP